MADWLLFFDIDNSIEAEGLLKILEAIDKMDKQDLYRFKKIEQGKEVDAHINTLLLYKNNFLKLVDWVRISMAVMALRMFISIFCGIKIGPSLLITDIELVQPSTQTVGLDRDTSINQKLFKKKFTVKIIIIQ